MNDQHLLDALRDLGGSAEAKDVYASVQERTEVPDQELNGSTKGGQSKFENKVGWARFYLSKAGLIDGSKRGVWALTPEGRETHLDHDTALAIFKDVQARFRVNDDDESDDDAPAPPLTDSANLFDDPNRRFWFVGAVWGDGTEDQTDRFRVLPMQ